MERSRPAQADDRGIVSMLDSMMNRITGFVVQAGLALSACLSATAVAQYQPAVQVGTITASDITEASGVAASRINANALWTHNDSGDSARVFAISTKGALLETFNLTGITNVDYEDIAVGPGPVAGVSYLYIGDIGDNSANRTSISVYRVPEPQVHSVGSPTTVNLAGAENISLVYPDGAHNAETLMVDPLNGDIYIMTKASPVGRVYEAPFPQSTSNTTTLTYLSSHNIIDATGGDISSDGSRLIIRNLTTAYEWTRSPGQSIASLLLTAPQVIQLHSEQQGEAIGYSYAPTAPGFFTLSEGTSQPLYFYAAAVPEPAGATAVGLAAIIGVAYRPRRRSKLAGGRAMPSHTKRECWAMPRLTMAEDGWLWVT